MKAFTFLSIALVVVASSLVFSPAVAYTEEDRAEAYKFVEDAGFPLLGAFTKMSPKHLRTILEAYGRVTSPDSFEYLSATDLEILYTAVSAANNCELCLSFHALALGEKLSKGDLNVMLAGGVPTEDERAAALTIAAKYALAHKGVLLEREKKHLATLGFDSEEKMLEIVYASSFMAANNAVYIHMISNGLELEGFLQEVGPFKDSVYAHSKDEL